MEQMALTLAEDPVMQSMTPQQLEKAIATARHRMEEAAQKLDFITAAKFRDEMYILEKFKNETGNGQEGKGYSRR